MDLQYTDVDSQQDRSKHSWKLTLIATAVLVVVGVAMFVGYNKNQSQTKPIHLLNANVMPHQDLGDGVQADTMTLFVRDLHGRVVTLFVEPDELIRNVKASIQHTLGVPVASQRLVYAGRLLENSRTLLDYNIQPYSTFYLILAIHGDDDEVSKNNRVVQNDGVMQSSQQKAGLGDGVQADGMTLFVRDLHGRVTTLYVEPNDSIRTVKAKIQNKLGVPIRLQRLIYAGVVLYDGYTLADYHIRSESVLYLILGLRG